MARIRGRHGTIVIYERYMRSIAVVVILIITGVDAHVSALPDSQVKGRYAFAVLFGLLIAAALVVATARIEIGPEKLRLVNLGSITELSPTAITAISGERGFAVADRAGNWFESTLFNNKPWASGADASRAALTAQQWWHDYGNRGKSTVTSRGRPMIAAFLVAGIGYAELVCVAAHH